MTQEKKPSSETIINTNEDLVQSQVSEMVRDTVEETLNACWKLRPNVLSVLSDMKELEPE